MPGELEALSLGGSILSSIMQEIDASGQRDKGNSILNDIKKRRSAGEYTYHTPTEILSNLNLAKNQFLDTKLPGQGLAENKLQSNTSQAIGMSRSVGRSPSDIIAGIVGANANENAGFNDLSVAASNRQYQDAQNYQTALQTKADYADKEFQYNTWMPMMADMQYGQQLVGAGNQNKYGGFDTLNSAFATAGGDDDLSSLFSKLFSKKGGTPATFKPN